MAGGASELADSGKTLHVKVELSGTDGGADSTARNMDIQDPSFISNCVLIKSTSYVKPHGPLRARAVPAEQPGGRGARCAPPARLIARAAPGGTRRARASPRRARARPGRASARRPRRSAGRCLPEPTGSHRRRAEGRRSRSRRRGRRCPRSARAGHRLVADVVGPVGEGGRVRLRVVAGLDHVLRRARRVGAVARVGDPGVVRIAGSIAIPDTKRPGVDGVSMRQKWTLPGSRVGVLGDPEAARPGRRPTACRCRSAPARSRRRTGRRGRWPKPAGQVVAHLLPSRRRAPRRGAARCSAPRGRPAVAAVVVGAPDVLQPDERAARRPAGRPERHVEGACLLGLPGAGRRSSSHSFGSLPWKFTSGVAS